MNTPNTNIILVIDDQVENLKVVVDMLAVANLTTIIARNGEEGVRRATFAQPDLILLDIMMPGWDGFETCRRLKADPKTQAIPIIFMTIKDDVKDKIRGFDYGAVDYVTKPIQVAELLARIRTHLRVSNLQRQLEQANANLIAQNRALQKAMATIQTLSGLIPICAWCGRKIQDEQGEWSTVESYIQSHSKATFTHGICPDCLDKLKS